jgi:phosphoglycolate phosphatase-like HAD superfamily hydrolase/predicted transcriptional regulator
MKVLNEFISKMNCLNNKDKLRILDLLAESEMDLDSISKHLKIKRSTTYKYIQQLLSAGFLSYRKLQGKKGRLMFRLEDFEFKIDKSFLSSLLKTKKAGEKLIIFDVDDTLVRRKDIPEQLSLAGKNAINEAKFLLEKKGIPISIPPKELFSEKWIYSKYGNSIKWFIGTWVNVAGVPEGDVKDKLVQKYVEQYYENIEQTASYCKLFLDVESFLQKHKNEFYFAAISNSSNKAVIEMLRNNGVLQFFLKDGRYLIIGGDEIPKSKETVEKILELAKVDMRNSFVVGDTGGDIKVSRDAGIPFDNIIAINRDVVPVSLLKSIQPSVKIISSFEGLDKIL